MPTILSCHSTVPFKIPSIHFVSIRSNVNPFPSNFFLHIQHQFLSSLGMVAFHHFWWRRWINNRVQRYHIVTVYHQTPVSPQRRCNHRFSIISSPEPKAFSASERAVIDFNKSKATGVPNAYHVHHHLPSFRIKEPIFSACLWAYHADRPHSQEHTAHLPESWQSFHQFNLIHCPS